MKKTRKKVIVLLMALMICILSACGEKDNANTESSKTETILDDSAVTENDESTSETKSEEEDKKQTPDELSDIYADLDNRSIKYNGHILTLGVSTLQDLVDAGYEPEDNYDKMWEWEFNPNNDTHILGTIECDIDVDYSNGASNTVLYFANPKESPIPMKECVLCMVAYSGFANDREKGGYSNSLEFSFSYDLTPDDLIANSGEPTVKPSDNTYEYMEISDKYPSFQFGYWFSFMEGNINRIYITWAPE